MSQIPLVSVIIPTFNRAHLISEAICSVLTQTFADFEIIVIDDGSTDTTAALIKSMTDSRIRYIYQDNQGISAARNAGILASQGHYIAFLDSDDIWLPELLEIEVPYLDEYKNIDIVYAKAQAMNQYGQPRAEILGTRERYRGQQLKSMLYGFFGCLPTTLLRKTCFDSAGLFDESLTGRVDWDMFLRLSQYHRFQFIDRVLARYRFHPGRTTGSKSAVFEEVMRNRVSVLDKYYSQEMLPASAVEVKPDAYRNAFIDIGMQYLSAGNYELARHSLWKALKHAPRGATLIRIIGQIILTNWVLKTRWGSKLIERLTAIRNNLSRAKRSSRD